MSVIQMIFIVETNEKTKSDNRYIRKLLDCIYDKTSNRIQFQFIEMGTKYQYNSYKVVSKRDAFIRLNADGINHVIYCFDTDRIDINVDHIRELREREEFCTKNNYKFVWSCYDIENVFLGYSVSDKDKKKESENFYRKKFILTPKMINCLSSGSKTNRHSNILTVLKDLYPFNV